MKLNATNQLALCTILATYSGICVFIAVTSWLDTYVYWVRRLIDGTRSKLVECRLAGQGHCWLCGMSHAFRAIWRGRIAEALNYNPHSVALFSVMVIGCMSGAAFAVRYYLLGEQLLAKGYGKMIRTAFSPRYWSW